MIEYTILEVNEEEIDLDQNPDYWFSLVGSKSESVLKSLDELSGKKTSWWSSYDDEMDDDIDEGVFCNSIGQI